VPGGFAKYGVEGRKPHVSGFTGSMWRRHTLVKREEKGEVVKKYRPRKRRRR